MRRHFKAVTEWQLNVSQFKDEKETEIQKHAETIINLAKYICNLQSSKYILYFSDFN